MEVEVISKETIKPSSPTPENLRHQQLSFLDQIQPPVYMPLVLFYPKVEGVNFSKVQQCDKIKKSLSEALTLFYPLAGRVKGNLYIDCNDEGVHYMEAEAKCMLSEFLENPNPAELNKFLPYELDHPNELPIAVQVTFFDCGGLVIGVVMSHKVSDALSVVMFLKSWTAIARGDSNIVSPQFHSAKLFPPKALSGFDPTTGMVKEKIVTKRFVFEASAIASIREKYSTEDKNIEYPRPSRVEALSAFIWSRFMAATQPKEDPDKIYTMVHAVNLRTRMDPPIPDYYFGNFSRIAFSVPSCRDTDDGFYGIIKPMRDAIKKVDVEFVKNLQQDDAHLNYIKERAARVKKGEVFSFAITSLCRFPLYEADFGWGKPAWVTTANMTFKNLVSFFDTKSGDGIEAWIFLKEEDMAKLETDEELFAYLR